jgi:hypothetical protein
VDVPLAGDTDAMAAPTAPPRVTTLKFETVTPFTGSLKLTWN